MTNVRLLALPIVAVSSTVALAAEGHDDMLIGASAAAGGQLLVDFDFDDTPHVRVSQAFNFGNGTSLFTSSAPGFDAATTEEDEGVFELADGTEVSIRLTAFDPGVSMQVRGTAMNTVGQSVVLGTYNGGEELHTHAIFQLIAPSDDVGLHDLSFELFQSNGGTTYGTSDTYTLTLQNAAAAVPEPAAAGLLSAAGLMALRRRRHASA
jgi:hypothetical protein